jgi:transposase
MTRFDREANSKRIVLFYNMHQDKPKSFCVNHFKTEGISESRIYKVIAKFEQYGTYEDRSRTGRPPKMNTKKVKRLRSLVNNKDGVSQRDLARRFDVSQSTISYTLNQKTLINCYEKEKAPGYVNDQEERARTRAAKLGKKIFVNNDVVMDDEKYFRLSNYNVPGNNNYYSENKTQAPPSIKYKKKVKFEPQVLVWVAMSSRGFSEIYVHTSKIAVNQNIYINECLKKRLLPFINEHHSDSNYVFWPDLASSHYAKKSIEWFESNGVSYVQKEDNPPNLPQGRPIETFWAILSNKVYERCWQAKSLKQLIRRIKSKFKELVQSDPSLGQRLMAGLKLKLRNIGLNGVYSENK